MFDEKKHDQLLANQSDHQFDFTVKPKKHPERDLDIACVSPHDFRVLTSAREKRIWMERFYQAYRGALNPLTASVFDDTNRYLVLNVGGSDVGFLHLSQPKGDFATATHTTDTWMATDGLVKTKFRNNGYHRMLIQHAIQHHDCKAVSLLEDRFLENRNYYTSLGLKHPFSLGTTLLRVFDDELFAKIMARLGHEITKCEFSHEDDISAGWKEHVSRVG